MPTKRGERQGKYIFLACQDTFVTFVRYFIPLLPPSCFLFLSLSLFPFHLVGEIVKDLKVNARNVFHPCNHFRFHGLLEGLKREGMMATVVRNDLLKTVG